MLYQLVLANNNKNILIKKKIDLKKLRSSNLTTYYKFILNR
jgi:hypothetical protein